MVLRKLLNLTLDSRLRRIFHKNVRAQQYVAVQLCFAGAVPTYGIDVHSRTHQIITQNRRALLVRRGGGDNLHALHAVSYTHLEHRRKVQFRIRHQCAEFRPG